jgi:hypothetical protein
MKLGHWKLKVRADTGIQGMGPCGELNEPDKPTEFRYLPHPDPPIQRRGYHQKDISKTYVYVLRVLFSICRRRALGTCLVLLFSLHAYAWMLGTWFV